MKKYIPIVAVILGGLMLVWVTLLVNRIQRACVDMGAADSANKVSLTIQEIDLGHAHGLPMDLLYASAGGVLFMCLLMFAILAATVLWMSKGFSGGKVA